MGHNFRQLDQGGHNLVVGRDRDIAAKLGDGCLASKNEANPAGRETKSAIWLEAQLWDQGLLTLPKRTYTRMLAYAEQHLPAYFER